MVTKTDDAVEVVRRALRRSSAEDRTSVMEEIVGQLIDHGDWGSICWWHGEIEHALMQYFQMLGRTRRAVCQHCYRNLGPGLQERLKGQIEIAHAMR